jgi:hypothetical protein
VAVSLVVTVDSVDQGFAQDAAIANRGASLACRDFNTSRRQAVLRWPQSSTKQASARWLMEFGST